MADLQPSADITVHSSWNDVRNITPSISVPLSSSKLQVLCHGEQLYVVHGFSPPHCAGCHVLYQVNLLNILVLFGRTVNHAKSHKVKVHACHPTLKLHRPCIDLKAPPHNKRHSKCSLAQQLSQARVHFGRISTTFIHYHTKWSNLVTKNILLSQICLIHDLQ